MQPMSHDAYERDNAPSQRAKEVHATPEMYEDQWAILKHEVEEDMQQRIEGQVHSGWDQRVTDEKNIAVPSPFDELVQASYDTGDAYSVDIVVVGVGGGGMNAVNRMILSRVRGVRYVAMNTDAQVLALSQAPDRICLGEHHTKGLGAGGVSAVGMRSATESMAEIQAALGNADLVFVAAGMGGGTGTGAAPVVASLAKQLGALTVGIVTLPFTFEGSRRRRVAEQGIAELCKAVDAVIAIPNDRLLTTIARDRSLTDAFQAADDVLRQGVQGIAEVINVPGMINVDFADVRSVLQDAGTALMSIGRGKGRNRALQAAEEAIAGGFLNVPIQGAQRVLFNISGGEDMTLFEVNEVAERIGDAVSGSADITFGAVVDPALSDSLRVTLIAAGMQQEPVSHGKTRMQGTMPATSMPTEDEMLSRSSIPRKTGASMPGQQRSYQEPAPIQLPPERQPTKPSRVQRSLSDLRGIRSMGRRRDLAKGNQSDNDDDIDVPPFMKH